MVNMPDVCVHIQLINNKEMEINVLVRKDIYTSSKQG